MCFDSHINIFGREESFRIHCLFTHYTPIRLAWYHSIGSYMGHLVLFLRAPMQLCGIPESDVLVLSSNSYQKRVQDDRIMLRISYEVIQKSITHPFKKSKKSSMKRYPKKNSQVTGTQNFFAKALVGSYLSNKVTSTPTRRVVCILESKR